MSFDTMIRKVMLLKVKLMTQVTTPDKIGIASSFVPSSYDVTIAVGRHRPSISRNEIEELVRTGSMQKQRIMLGTKRSSI